MLYEPPLPSWLKARPPSEFLTEEPTLPYRSLPEDAERPVEPSLCVFNPNHNAIAEC